MDVSERRGVPSVAARAAAARERVEARIAAAVAEAPPLPDDVVQRLRELVVLSQVPSAGEAPPSLHGR